MNALQSTVRQATLDRLRSHLPAHTLSRDAEAGGLLETLLRAVSGELSLLEADLDDLYDAWFVETCADWVLPYLADLVGLDELATDLGRDAGPRALVANTVAYRRRKGTVGVLEQIAGNVTGWPAHAVEFYRLLVTSAHVNHVRLDRPATASVRDASRTELCGLDLAGARTLAPGLDPLAHTAEVRRIATGRGRYGIPAIGVFLHPLHVYEVGAPGDPTAVAARTRTDGGWSQARRRTPGGHSHTFDPFGRPAPLFAPPADGERTGGIEHLAEEPDLPVPLRPRRLLALLKAARKTGAGPGALPFGVRVGPTGTDLRPCALTVHGLEPLDPTLELQADIDPVDGTITCYRMGRPHPADVFVRYVYGASAEVGAGTHDRSGTHETALGTTSRGPAEHNAGLTVGQISVRSGAALDPAHEVPTLGQGLAKAWDTLRFFKPSRQGDPTYVVSVADSATYAENNLRIDVPRGTRVILVAAGWPRQRSLSGAPGAPSPGAYTPEGVRPHVLGGLTITGGEGSSIVLDGLALEGDLVVAPGRLAALTISQCTLSGPLRVEGTGPEGNTELRVDVLRSVLTDVTLNAPVPSLCVSNSAIDGSVSADAAHAGFEGCTVRGDVTVRSLDGSSCVFDGKVTAEHRQAGCLRFSYTGPGSRTPRRYRCVPAEAHGRAPGPVYASVDPGSPVYLALGRGCPEDIRTGGEHGAEMGVHHHLRRPLRLAAAARALAPYLPVQLEIGTCRS